MIIVIKRRLRLVSHLDNPVELAYMQRHPSWGAFHLFPFPSELKTGQTLLVVTRISLLIKTIQPDQSNPKYYARKRWFFSKNSWEKPISLSNNSSSDDLAGQFQQMESALRGLIKGSLGDLTLTLSLPNVAKGKFRPNVQISFAKILTNK